MDQPARPQWKNKYQLFIEKQISKIGFSGEHISAFSVNKHYKAMYSIDDSVS